MEWRVLREETSWDEHFAGQAGVLAESPTARGRLWPMATALLLLVMSAGLYLWRAAEKGVQVIEGELQAAVEAEQRLALFTAAFQVSSDLPASKTNVQVQSITFQGDLAIVEVETDYTDSSGQPRVFRQLHFYQPTAIGWVRVPADSPHLGPIQTLETASFIVRYHRQDADAVIAVAAGLDELYAELRRDYGLSPAAEKLPVDVGVEMNSPGQIRRRIGSHLCFGDRQLCVASPSLTALPADLSGTQVLHLWLLNALAYHLRREALLARAFRYEWQYANNALPRLQMRRHNELLAAWDADLAHWLYESARREPQPDSQSLAQELRALCNRHHILEHMQILEDMPSTALCISPPLKTLERFPRPPDRLRELIMPAPYLLLATTESWIHALAFETVFDYALAAYGADSLPALMEGFRRYSTWSELIPAVFRVSVEEFERGWQEYLAEL
jgi:hypothetical protein